MRSRPTARVLRHVPFRPAVAALVAAAATAQAAPARFPADYVDHHRGRHAYEVAAGLELALVLTAIACRDAEPRLDPTRRGTAYHDEVLQRFGPFADHPVFDAVAIDPNDLGSYRALRNNSYCWTLRDGRLESLEFLGKWWRGDEFADTFAPNAELLQAFCDDAGFAAFFAGHRDDYERMAAAYEGQVDLARMVTWLRGHFGGELSSIRILFSPLMRGNQSTTIKRSGDFTQVFIITDPPHEDGDPSRALGAFKWVFTELDHQYVNPVSDRHATRIEGALADRARWTAGKQSEHYPAPVPVWNEYMTWAVYLLFVLDHYPADPAAEHVESVVRYMEARRGFPRFGAFLAELRRLLAERGGRIADLYPAMLDWAEG